jgi:hypothetical protein
MLLSGLRGPIPAPPRLTLAARSSCFASWFGGRHMLTVIIIVAIILVALYVMRDRLPQLRR